MTPDGLFDRLDEAVHALNTATQKGVPVADVPPTRHPGATALVIDDSEDILHLVGTILRTAGFSVRSVHGADIFLLRRRETWEGVDVAVVDLQMPWIGTEVVSFGRTISSRVGAVLMTAWPEFRVREYLTAFAFLEVLFKPFEVSEVVSVVDTALENRPP